MLAAAWHCLFHQVAGLEPSFLGLEKFKLGVWDPSKFLACEGGHSPFSAASAIRQPWLVCLGEG